MTLDKKLTREERGARRPRGSSSLIVLLVIVTIGVIIAGVTTIRDRRGEPSAPQTAGQNDTRAFYIAQTALDRSIKALVADPKWRDGYNGVAFDKGTYTVEVVDANDPLFPENDRSDLPRNYVRIVASSEVDGVTKRVEAVWVNAMSAFYNAYTARNSIDIGHDGGVPSVLPGNIHNNAWAGGSIELHAGTTVYGDVTSVGDIAVGVGGDAPARVYGNVRGKRVRLSATADVRRFESVSEKEAGLDLNGDGDASDIGLTREPIHVVGSKGVACAERSLRTGETDPRIGDGRLAVRVGGRGVGPIADPRPDFVEYYELASGLSTYPPSRDHVLSPIMGDGDGHYFSSADAFLGWIRRQRGTTVFCWRCAGQGRIDPAGQTICPACEGTGRDIATEITGVFYIDAGTLDLSALGVNLVVHGTIVVARGNPYTWPSRTVDAPGEPATIAHFPKEGRFVLSGDRRMHFMQTYRSDKEGGAYIWRKRTVGSGVDAQLIPISEAIEEYVMYDFPAIITPEAIEIGPRGAGFAYFPGDIGDEMLTVLQGVLYSEGAVRIHGRGGWRGESLVFDEETERGGDDVLDEAVLNIDLNGDGDVFDRVDLASISTVPVIPVSNNRYNVDVDNDGVLGKITVGADYARFFLDGRHRFPTLVYHEGLVLGGSIHSCEGVLVIFDPRIAAAGVPFGFEVSYGSTLYQGLVSWHERTP